MSAPAARAKGAREAEMAVMRPEIDSVEPSHVVSRNHGVRVGQASGLFSVALCDFLTLLDARDGDFISLLRRKICGPGRAVLQGLAFAVSFNPGGFLPDRLDGRLRERHLRATR